MRQLRIGTAFGLELYFDGSHKVRAVIPKNLKGLICGLCGNYNDDRTDDLVDKNGIDHSGEESHIAHALVGDSWLVSGYSPAV